MDLEPHIRKGVMAMSYEYRVTTDKTASIIELNLIYDYLRECSYFQNVTLTKHGISVPNEHGNGFELVGIELIDEGFFVTANVNRTERKVLLDVIQKAMSNNGINIVLEEE